MTHWQTKNFDELSKNELYDILKFRISIFMLEQKSLYEDLDNIDQEAFHFLGYDQQKIIAYGRVHIHSENHFAVIRRVCIHPQYRDQKLGVQLIYKILKYTDTIKNLSGIELDAQCYLQKFYEKFGFNIDGAPYDDGGVMHVRMVKNLVK